MESNEQNKLMNKIEKNKGVDDNNDSSQHEHKNDGGTDTLQD